MARTSAVDKMGRRSATLPQLITQKSETPNKTFKSQCCCITLPLFFNLICKMSDEYDDQFISFIHLQAKEAKVKHEKKQSKYHDDSRE